MTTLHNASHARRAVDRRYRTRSHYARGQRVGLAFINRTSSHWGAAPRMQGAEVRSIQRLPARRGPSSQEQPQRPLPRASVLVVDDEPQVRIALEDALGTEFEVLTADSASAALAILRARPDISVVITDQRMPSMNGDELLASVSEHRAARILITGYADVSAIVRSINEGRLFAYVSKPWDVEDLWAKVHGAAEKVRLEQELSEERAQLRAKTALLDSVLGSMSEGVIATDLKGHALLFNAAAQTLLGRAPDEALASEWTRLYDLRYAGSGAPIPAHQLPVCRVLAGEDHAQVEMLVNREGDAKDIEVVATSSVLTDGAGARRGSLTVLRDVTQERVLEAQLLQSQKMEAVGQLAGGVAHDFNNLLAAITGFAELALMDRQPGPGYEELSEILEVVHRGTALTRQLLSFSRDEVLHEELFDMNRQVAQLETMLQRLLGYDIQLTTRLGAKLCQLWADPGQIEQVLLNLVVNARDAMPDGGRIEVRVDQVHIEAGNAPPARVPNQPLAPGSYVRLQVEDTGTGIEPETVDRIFDPFFTTKEQGKGTGLGLSTVAGIVRRNKGYLSVRTELGRGTCFTCYFPSPVDTSFSPPAKPSHVRRTGTPTETILVIEQDEEVRGVTARSLRKYGYRVLQARSAARAAPLWARYREEIDALLLDATIHDERSERLLEQLLREKPSLRVAYMSSGHPHMVDGQPTPCLQKPFAPVELARLVRNLLDE